MNKRYFYLILISLLFISCTGSRNFSKKKYLNLKKLPNSEVLVEDESQIEDETVYVPNITEEDITEVISPEVEIHISQKTEFRSNTQTQEEITDESPSDAFEADERMEIPEIIVYEESKEGVRNELKRKNVDNGLVAFWTIFVTACAALIASLIIFSIFFFSAGSMTLFFIGLGIGAFATLLMLIAWVWNRSIGYDGLSFIIRIALLPLCGIPIMFLFFYLL